MLKIGQGIRRALIALVASLTVLLFWKAAQAQECNQETGLPPGQEILGPHGEQFFPQNTNCPDEIVAPQCEGGTILRYVDPADPNRLVRYACVASAQRGETLPLIVFFHGSRIQTVDEEFSGFEGKPPRTDLLARVKSASLAPRKLGYILLMPQGRCITAPEPPVADGDGMHFDEWYKDAENNLDIRATLAFIQQLIDRTTLDDQGNLVPLPNTITTIDTQRIYLMGSSNGAFFAHLMGLMFSDQIAAVATHAGADPFARGPCPVPYPPASRRIPVMVVHATCDPIVLCDCNDCDTTEATVAQWFEALAENGWSSRILNNLITNTRATRRVGRCQFTDIDRQRLCPEAAHKTYPNALLPTMFRFLKKYSLPQ